VLLEKGKGKSLKKGKREALFAMSFEGKKKRRMACEGRKKKKGLKGKGMKEKRGIPRW